MTHIICKIQDSDPSNIINLTQKVISNKYLILDLWHHIKNCKDSEQKNKQIFLQFNDVELHSLSNNIIQFNVTDRKDITDGLARIEQSIMNILRDYLLDIGKRGKFSFRSIVRDDESNDQTYLIFNTTNPDYDIAIFNQNKQRIYWNDMKDKHNSKFNFIIELLSVQLDMVTGLIAVESKLRMIIENKTMPARIQLTDVNDFITDPEHCENAGNNSSSICFPDVNLSGIPCAGNTHSDNHRDEKSEMLQNIETNFDITKTEAFENSDQNLFHKNIDIDRKDPDSHQKIHNEYLEKIDNNQEELCALSDTSEDKDINNINVFGRCKDFIETTEEKGNRDNEEIRDEFIDDILEQMDNVKQDTELLPMLSSDDDLLDVGDKIMTNTKEKSDSHEKVFKYVEDNESDTEEEIIKLSANNSDETSDDDIVNSLKKKLIF